MSFIAGPSDAGGVLSAPPAFRSEQLAAAGIAHGFFGRRGGVSVGRYESLNAGPGSGDAREAVAENRKRLAGALGAAPERMLGLRQIHSPTALWAAAPWPGDPPEADALATAQPGLALCVLTADCMPVLMADPAAGVVGAAHAGWRGALSGILEATLARMTEAGAQADRIIAALGPAIRLENYEIGPEFEARFLADSLENKRFFKPGPGPRRHFDLPAFCQARLARAGIGAIDDLGLDTYAAAADFFSCRRAAHAGEPDYGRNAALILAPE